jgi:hypothetical protein
VDTGTVIPGLSDIAVGVLAISICIPLFRNKVEMNQWYGIRFKKSFESTANWYKINRYGARRMILWSVIIIVIGAAGLFLAFRGRGDLQTAVACAPLLLIIPAIESWIYARRLPSNDRGSKGPGNLSSS